MNDSKTVNKSISIQAPVERVCEVLIHPASMSEWLSDSTLEIKSVWKIGSTITFSGNRYGIVHEDKGTLLELEPGKILKYNHWTSISRLPDETANRSIMCFELKPINTGTLLQLTHSNLVALAAWEHSSFYWNATLEIIRNMAEREITQQAAEHLHR